MRNASVLIVNLRGLAAEVCKNIVLAGIGKLTIADERNVAEEDLGSGYFFRESDFGSKVRRRRIWPCADVDQRVDAAAPRIQALNPRVEVIASTSLAVLDNAAALRSFDLVCLTESDAATAVRELAWRPLRA